MAAKPIKTLELHYSMIMFLIIHVILTPTIRWENSKRTFVSGAISRYQKLKLGSIM